MSAARLNAVRDTASTRASISNPGAVSVDKWKLIRSLTECRRAYGLSDRTLVVLEALVSFHSGKALRLTDRLIVFPSNAELSVRSRGMAPATLRRHLAALVDAGFVLRRDSANGKRYARRDASGEVQTAFGFDLTPLLCRADEIMAKAASVLADEKKRRAFRADITIILRDVSQLLAHCGDETDLVREFEDLCGRIARTASLDELQTRLYALASVKQRVEHLLFASSPEGKVSANERQNERHIESPKTESLQENKKEDVCSAVVTERSAGKLTAVKSQNEPVSLHSLRRSCPQIWDYGLNGEPSWTGLQRAADVVRRMLLVSDDAWFKACQAMGRSGAAVAIAAILEKVGTIASPGGYLRSLTAKAARGALSLASLLDASQSRPAWPS